MLTMAYRLLVWPSLNGELPLDGMKRDETLPITVVNLT